MRRPPRKRSKSGSGAYRSPDPQALLTTPISANIHSMPPKRITSFALSKEALDLLGAVAGRRGLSRTATLETLIRNEAEKMGLWDPASPTPGPQP
jgi:hypothetical protein